MRFLDRRLKALFLLDARKPFVGFAAAMKGVQSVGSLRVLGSFVIFSLGRRCA
jgi:hypothetical protein